MATKKTASTASSKRPAASKSASKTAGKTAGKKASSSKKTLPYPFANLPLPAPLNEKAQQIWAAGLAAFANAQAEGGKVGQLFETLVQEGQSLQRKAQDLADEGAGLRQPRAAHVAGGEVGQRIEIPPLGPLDAKKGGRGNMRCPHLEPHPGVGQVRPGTGDIRPLDPGPGLCPPRSIEQQRPVCRRPAVTRRPPRASRA